MGEGDVQIHHSFRSSLPIDSPLLCLRYLCGCNAQSLCLPIVLFRHSLYLCTIQAGWNFTEITKGGGRLSFSPSLSLFCQVIVEGTETRLFVLLVR